jgi:hypothetical protein
MLPRDKHTSLAHRNSLNFNHNLLKIIAIRKLSLLCTIAAITSQPQPSRPTRGRSGASAIPPPNQLALTAEQQEQLFQL